MMISSRDILEEKEQKCCVKVVRKKIFSFIVILLSKHIASARNQSVTSVYEIETDIDF